MANASIENVISVLPVAITVFKNTTANDIINKAPVTTRKVGIAASTNSSPCPNIDRNCFGKMLSSNT